MPRRLEELERIDPPARTPEQIVPALRKMLARGPCSPATLESALGCTARTLAKAIELLAEHHTVQWRGARSYSGQKQVEAFSGGEKPQVLVQGHYHVSNYMIDRNVYVIGMPGFQDQTIFARKKRLRMEVGGAILSFTVTKAGSIGRLGVEFNMYFDRGFYKPYLRSDKRLLKGHLVLGK